jgi:hypothetical protein
MTSGLRSIAAGRDGLRCYYCSCPTGGELEHMNPRAKGGKSNLENLALSCPLCNRRKGARRAQEFKESGDWRLLAPELPDSMDEMLLQFFGTKGPAVFTGRKNSYLKNEDEVIIYIRPGRGYEWTTLKLENKDSKASVHAAWDFLTRHHTPEKPRRRRGRRSKR